MKCHQVIALCVLSAAGTVLASGCTHRTVVQPAPVVVKEQSTSTPIIIQSETMPAPRTENPGPPPSTEDVWVSGHWEKTDRGWMWREGHWERR